MGAIGYVVLKIKGKKMFYIDWTNTRREYDINNLNPTEIEDFKRLFNSNTIILILLKSKTLSILNKKLGEIDCSRVLEIEGSSNLPKLFFTYLSINNIPGGFYNHRRGAFLSVISILNLHILIYGLLTKKTIIKIINNDLKKYWKKTKAKVVFEGFVNIGLLKKINRPFSILEIEKGPYFTI